MNNRRESRYQFLIALAMFSGNATFLRNLKDAMADRDDVDVTWLPIETDPREWITRMPLIGWNWSLRGSLATRMRLRALEQSGKRFDAALFHHQALMMFLGPLSRSVPLVISMDATPRLHDSMAYWYEKKTHGNIPLANSVRRSVTRSAYERASFLLPFSDWAKDSLMRDYQIPECKIRVVPPGVNLSRWTDPGPRHRPQRARATNILFVGGHFMRKGGDMLLEASRREEFRNCEFHFVTADADCGRNPNVFIHTGLTANSDELVKLYRDADIFVLPTRADFHSWATLEAMASRLPVVTTSVGGLREVVADGVNGFTVPVDDHAALADRLRTLAGDPDLRERLGAEGRRLIETKFTLRGNAELLLTALKKAADTGRTQPHGAAQ